MSCSAESGCQRVCTEWMEWMSHMKRGEAKQQPSMLTGPAVPGCCLVYFCFLCDIHSIHSVHYGMYFQLRDYTTARARRHPAFTAPANPARARAHGDLACRHVLPVRHTGAGRPEEHILPAIAPGHKPTNFLSLPFSSLAKERR